VFVVWDALGNGNTGEQHADVSCRVIPRVALQRECALMNEILLRGSHQSHAAESCGVRQHVERFWL